MKARGGAPASDVVSLTLVEFMLLTTFLLLLSISTSFDGMKEDVLRALVDESENVIDAALANLGLPTNANEESIAGDSFDQADDRTLQQQFEDLRAAVHELQVGTRVLEQNVRELLNLILENEALLRNRIDSESWMTLTQGLTDQIVDPGAPYSAAERVAALESAIELLIEWAASESRAHLSTEALAQANAALEAERRESERLRRELQARTDTDHGERRGGNDFPSCLIDRRGNRVFFVDLHVTESAIRAEPRQFAAASADGIPEAVLSTGASESTYTLEEFRSVFAPLDTWQRANDCRFLARVFSDYDASQTPAAYPEAAKYQIREYFYIKEM